MKPTLIIVRGIPGSGKSTFANELATQFDCLVFEADNYFMKNGEYTYNPKALGYVHTKCLEDAVAAAYRNDIAIVANCDIRWRDLKIVLGVCRDAGIDVAIFDVVGDFGSVHNVPEFRMERIRQGFSMFTDVIPFFLRDGYDPAMVRAYAVVTPVFGGEPKVDFKDIDFTVEPAPAVRK